MYNSSKTINTINSLYGDVYVYTSEHTRSVFAEVLAQISSTKKTVADFEKLHELVSNACWYNVADTDSEGRPHFFYSIGHRSAMLLCQQLYTTKASVPLYMKATLSGEYRYLDFDSSKYEEEDDEKPVTFCKIHQIYIRPEFYTDKLLFQWYSVLHSAGFRLLDGKVWRRMLFGEQRIYMSPMGMEVVVLAEPETQ